MLTWFPLPSRRLQAIDSLELSRRQREEALNHLEGYLYRLRDMLAPESEGSLFWQFSQAAEREQLANGVREGMQWLEEEGWKAETAALRKRADDLACVLSSLRACPYSSSCPQALTPSLGLHPLRSAIEKPAQFRNTEARTRAGAVEKFQQALFAGRACTSAPFSLNGFSKPETDGHPLLPLLAPSQSSSRPRKTRPRTPPPG